MRHWLQKAVCICLCFGMLFGFANAEDVPYIAPTLPSDADPYDPAHPELLDEDQLYAKSAILIEASSDEVKVIFEKDADLVMYPASTTKIMTVLLGIMLGDMSQTVYLTESAMEGVGEDAADMDLEVGESIVFEDLLFGTFVRSANEGANLIAETVGGTRENFADMMNAYAAMYGMNSTHFVNPSGLHDDNHYSTVRDMATLAAVAMKNETFRAIAKTHTYSLPKSNLHRSRVLTHSSRKFFNPSLEENDYYYPYAIGIKSGYHSRAGYCFVGAAEKDGILLISVVFYTTENGRWTDTKKLMDYGFSQYVSMTPQELYRENPIVVETSAFSMDDPGFGRLELGVQTRPGARTVSIVATKAEMESMARNPRQTMQIEYTRDFVAPIAEGEIMGTMTYYPEDGGSPVIYDLVATRTIVRRANAPLSLEEIEAEVYADPNPFPPLSVELVMILLLPVSGVALGIRLLIRLFGKGDKKERKRKGIRIPKPKDRYYR